MVAMQEIVVGFGMMLESALYDIKSNFLKSAFIFVALLSICHYLMARAERGKILKLSRMLIVALIILACVSGFVYYYQKTLYSYVTLVPNMEPADLKCNYYGALESSLYDSTLGDQSGWLTGMPVVFTPPTLAFLNLSTVVLGDNFVQYGRNYRIYNMALAALTLLMLIGFTLKRLGGQSIREAVLIAFSINTFLFLFLLFVTDIRIGNTNTIVGFLIATQLFMTLWKNDLSKFLQAFLLVLAWWIKPNMILVLWCLTVFSISRKDYPYFAGLVCGVVVPIGASLLAANVTLGTYVIYFADVSRIIEQTALSHTSNLSIFLLAGNPVLAYKIGLILGALLVLLYTTKIKGDDFKKFEIFCFMITYIFWTRVWPYYFIPVALIAWINIVDLIDEGRQIYLEIILILALSMSIALINIVGVNIMLVANAVVYLGRHISSPQRQIVAGYESV